MGHLQTGKERGIVIKIGTESLFHWENGAFWGKKIETLCLDIKDIIRNTSHNVALVTSGAVGFGKKIIGKEFPDNRIIPKQYLASIGQKALIAGYDGYFSKHRNPIKTGQILVTHADIEDDEARKKSVRDILEYHFEMRTLPIINENDTISSEEMQALGRGADNDRNALLIAKLIGAKVLYIITNSNGVYRDRDDPGSRIEVIRSGEFDTPGFIERIAGGKSEHGTGGMRSKLEVALEASRFGIETRILDGMTSTVGNYDHRREYAGTTIQP